MLRLLASKTSMLLVRSVLLLVAVTVKKSQERTIWEKSTQISLKASNHQVFSSHFVNEFPSIKSFHLSSLFVAL